MATKAVVRSMLLLRIFCLVASLSSAAVLSRKEISEGRYKKRLMSQSAYRYELFTAVLGVVYIVVQLPFAVYHACTEKRMIRGLCLLEIDLYGDKIISLFLATGVASGFAVSLKLESLYTHEINFSDAIDKTTELKLHKCGIVSTVVLFWGFVCMVIVSILSSISSTRGFLKSSASSHGTTELPTV